MRSKSFTFALAASLGVFGSAGRPCLADGNGLDRSSDLLIPADGAQAPRSPQQKRADEYLAKAQAELEAGHFDTARRLAKEAAKMDVTFGLFDMRPEHLLAEIDRRERSPHPFNRVVGNRKVGAPRSLNSAVQSTSAGRMIRSSSSDNLKAQAIGLLDKGLLALEQKRFDDADRLARSASEMGVVWNQGDYRPENLLADITAQRTGVVPANQRTKTVKDGAFQLVGASQSPGSASLSNPASPWDSTPHAFRGSESHEEVGMPWNDAAKPGALAPSTAGRSAEVSADAQKLLEEAGQDLQAGRKEAARQRIARAYELMASTESLANAHNRSVPATWPSPLSTASASISSVKSNAESRSHARIDAPDDEVFLPLHDPYLGDQPLHTQKGTATELRLREATPPSTPIGSNDLPTATSPPRANSQVRQAVYNDNSRIPKGPERGDASQSVIATAGYASRSPSQSSDMAATNSAKPVAHAHDSSLLTHGEDFKPAKVAPPIAVQGRYAVPGRVPGATPSDPHRRPTPDGERPGFFRRMWGAMTGD